MNREKILGYVELCGETLVVLAAATWMKFPEMAQWVMASGVLAFAIGRFSQVPFYQKYNGAHDFTLRRLYHQRVFGMVALILATAAMFLPVGFYWGLYLGHSSWLVLFVVFVVIEVYTTFRISAVEKS